MNRIIEDHRVRKTDGCWLWEGSLNVKGYGQIGYRENGKQRTMGAHKMAYIQEVGPVKEGLHVCHKCDVRNCVRPDHLFVGTQQENMDDMVRKGRIGKKNAAKIAQTHCKHGHEFTPENTGYKNRGTKRSHGRRFCRICKNLSVAKSMAKPESKARYKAWREKRKMLLHTKGNK